MSDRKIAVDQNNDGTIDYYTADVISATDYYPFGFEMPGRKYNSDKSVYGFNGKRKDNDIYGEGNAYDFSSRMYNSRLGKWFSVDAVQKKYPAWSPYNYAMNSPLKLKDDDGEDVIVTISGNSITFSSTIYVTGPGATDVAKNANTSFDNFSKSALQNRTYKDAEGKIYNVQIKMNYVAVNPDDPKEDPAKVAAYNSTKNDKVGGSGNNIIQTTADSKLRANAGHPASKSYDMGVMAKQTFIAGNGAEQVRMVNIPSAGNLAYVRNDESGSVTNHETLHLIGLGDRYIEGLPYNMTTTLPDGTQKTECLDNVTAPAAGFENDIMANSTSGGGFSQTHINNLSSKALELSKSKGNNFVMSQNVDNATNRDKGKEAKEFTSDKGKTKYTKLNP